MSINLEKDQQLKNTIQNLELNENFLNKNFVNKSKQYDFLPIAYNSHVLANHIRYNQQQQHLQLYQQMIQDHSHIEDKAVVLTNKIELIKEEFDKTNNLIKSVIKDAQKMNQDNVKYQKDLERLKAKKDVLSGIYKDLTFSEQEKKILFGQDDDLDAIQGDDEGQQNTDEEELRFDRFKQDFFKALKKLRKMQDILALLSISQTTSPQLANSIKESIQYVEDNAYAKLVKHLRNKIRLFDTPLESQPDFLTFMKVTLKMLKDKSRDMYAHIINELIKSRAKYIEISYQEKSNLIFNPQFTQKSNGNQSQQNSAKNVAIQIAWLHETIMNELQILDHTSLDKTRYLDALNSIFTRKLAKQVKLRLEQEITAQEDISSAFELYYLLISFLQVMQSYFSKILQTSSDLSDFLILSFLPDLKSKSLTRLTDCFDQFLSKLSNLFFSHSSQSTLVVERMRTVGLQMLSKMIEVAKNDSKDMQILKRRILMYAITRILPSSNLNLVDDTTISPSNLIQMFNYFDQMSSLIPKDLQQQDFSDLLELINERVDQLSSAIKITLYNEIQGRPQVTNLLQTLTIDEYKVRLEELEEDMEYEDIKISSLSTLQNNDMKQLIIEMVKEELINDLKQNLEDAVHRAYTSISQDQQATEEQKDERERRINYMHEEMIEKLEYACTPTMKFCDSNGKFDSITKFQLFEGSIALYQSAFYNLWEEKRTSMLNPNPSQCSSRGLSQSQLQVLTVQQIGNVENDWDNNINPDYVYNIYNNKSSSGVQAFIGNVLSLQRCSYLFNFNYDGSNSIDYNIQKFTVSIEYNDQLMEKRTVLTKKADYKWSQSKTLLGYYDLPCSATEIYYHPGLRGIFYFMDDGYTLIFKVDRSLTSTADPCESNLFESNNIGQYQLNLKTEIETNTNYRLEKILQNPVFLNNTLFIFAHVRLTTDLTKDYTRIYKVTLTPTSATAFTKSFTGITDLNGFVDQVAAFELQGFIYTMPNATGYYLQAMNIATLNSRSGSPVRYASAYSWKLYQTRSENHMYRPIYGVQSTSPSAFYRLTRTQTLVFNDLNSQTNFYDMTAQFARYHALLINPGSCGSARTTTDYDNIKAVIVNLRRMEIEKCMDISLIGCGDAKLNSANSEQCDDGNLNSGDGCSALCQVEQYYNCTHVEGERSVCTAVICGNTVVDSGEECDDGNFVSGDGCSDVCVEEKGYDCGSTGCINMCGDGQIYQQRKLDANGISYVFYTEECDGIKGCNNSTCTADIGWKCTVDANLVQTCVQTCGNNLHDDGEICDDGDNLDTGGCAKGCKSVISPYVCPEVGACNLDCGNDVFEGEDASVRQNGTRLNEQCDDGNNNDGDGCSASCKIESGYTCSLEFKDLVLEIPRFRSNCVSNGGSGGGGGSSGGFVQQYYRMIPYPLFQFVKYRYDFANNAGRFRLIEYGDNLNLYGVTLTYQAEAEYIKVKQLVGGAYTYFEETTYDLNFYKAAQRGTFGKYYVRNKNYYQFDFFAYVASGGDVTFTNFYTSESDVFNKYLGSHEIYWWPYMQMILGKYIDGYTWKTLTFTPDVIDIASNPAAYSQSEQIETSLTKEFILEGQQTLQPIFYQSYIINYARISDTTSKFSVHKYYKDIDYLGVFNEDRTNTDNVNADQGRYSFVFFNQDFGLIIKHYNSAVIDRFSVTSMTFQVSPSFDANGYFDKDTYLPQLVMIQRRQDPDNSQEERDVYAYYDNSAIYKIQADASANSLKVIDKITVPSTILGLDIASGLIDVGMYHIAVYSGANCDSVSEQTYITASSAWFYTFSTQQWSCMNLDNTFITSNPQPAWRIQVS